MRIRWRESRPNSSPHDSKSERKDNWSQQIRQTDVAVHFTTNSICYSVDDLRTVLRGIDVHTEWPLTEGHVHHVDDCFRDIGHVSVSRRSSGETLHDVVAEVRVRAIVVLSLTCLVCRRTGMREV